MSAVVDTKPSQGTTAGIVLLMVALIVFFLLDAILARVIKPHRSAVMSNG